MSRHYQVIEQAAFTAQGVSISEILAKIGKTRPDLAARFAKVDWAGIRREFAEEALAQVAKETGATLTKRLDGDAVLARADRGSRVTGEAPKGECLGVLDKNGEQLGLFMDGETFAWATIQSGRETKAVTDLRTRVETVFAEKSAAGAARFLGKDVKTSVQGKGDEEELVIDFRLKGGA